MAGENQKAALVETKGGTIVEVEIEPRRNSRPLCSGCGQARPGYDREKEPRRFEFVPLWGMAVFFLYAMRRVDFPQCGVKVERVPWADGKHHLTITYQVFLAQPSSCPGSRWPERFTPAGITCVAR